MVLIAEYILFDARTKRKNVQLSTHQRTDTELYLLVWHIGSVPVHLFLVSEGGPLLLPDMRPGCEATPAKFST